MEEARCEMCGRPVASDADRCGCGASVDWLRAAPAMLRARLRRTIAGAVISTLATGCNACAAPITDAGIDAHNAADAHAAAADGDTD